jgi:hypothetical protein
MRKSLFLFWMFGATACGGADSRDVLDQASDAATWRLSDSGIRCATAPCPSLRATPVSEGKSALVSEIHFPTTMSPDDRHGVLSRAATSGGLVVRGSVRGAGDNGVFELESIIE